MEIENPLGYRNACAQIHCTTLLPGNLTNAAQESKMLADFELIGSR